MVRPYGDPRAQRGRPADVALLNIDHTQIAGSLTISHARVAQNGQNHFVIVCRAKKTLEDLLCALLGMNGVT